MRDKRRKTPGISLSAAGRHTRLAPGHAGAGKAGTPFWRRTDRHNAPRKAPLWSALSSLLLLWLGVGGTVFAVITGFDLPVGRGAVALSCAAVPAVVWFLALPLRAARLLRLPALLLGAALLASAGENALRGAVLTAQNITQAYHAYFPAVPVWFSDVPMTLGNRSLTIFFCAYAAILAGLLGGEGEQMTVTSVGDGTDLCYLPYYPLAVPGRCAAARASEGTGGKSKVQQSCADTGGAWGADRICRPMRGPTGERERAAAPFLGKMDLMPVLTAKRKEKASEWSMSKLQRR